VPGAGTDVAVQGAGGVVPDRDHPFPAALAAYPDRAVLQVNVAAPGVVRAVADPGDLPGPDPGGPEYRDHRRVAALRERPAAQVRSILGRSWSPKTGRAMTASMRRGRGELDMAPDGSWLASSGDDGTARIWDVAAGQEQVVLSGHTDMVRALAVGPDGSWLASSGDDGTVRIWDVAAGQEQVVLSGHTDMVRALAVAPDGSWLASGGWDATVRIWDVATGHERAVLSGHTDAVEAVAMAPDGSWLASGSWDKTVRIWDVATGHERAVLSGRTDWVKALAVSPDGSWLASGSGDGVVRIWHTVTCQPQTMMRVDSDITTCAWLGSDALLLGGSAGLYLFDFLTETGGQAILRPP